MFDVGAPELLVIIIVAVLVIGPKDMPVALRMAGRWIGKMRRMSNHFRSGVETMIREAELEEMEKKWQEQNRKVMEQHPSPPMTAANAAGEDFVSDQAALPPAADAAPALPAGEVPTPPQPAPATPAAVEPITSEPAAASAEARVKPVADTPKTADEG